MFVSQADSSTIVQSSGEENDPSETHTAIPHMEWTGERFEKQAPQPPPLMTIRVEVITDKHAIPTALPLPPGFRSSPVTTTTLADSGAQTCSGDLELLTSLGCTPENLITTTHGIRGVTQTSLCILGVLPVRVTVGGNHTNQIMYFSRNTRGCLLSEKALMDLKVLPTQFPSISGTESTSASAQSSPTADCGCPRRLPPPPLPSEIPLPATSENVLHLENWIKGFFRHSAFNTCPHQPIPAMSGEPMKVTVREDAVPYAAYTPIPVPLHWEEEILKDLEKDIALGIIEPVPSTTPTIWCARAVWLQKKSGKPRRAVDFGKFNASTRRHHHHTPSPFQQAIKVPARVYKTILDAWNGYHSIALDKSVRDYFTFICKWGRFRYLRCPQGYHGSGDVYTHHFDEITKNFVDKVRQVDDSCLWKSTIELMFWHVMQYIHHCHINGVIFNHEKFVFCRHIVEFAGFLLTYDGIKPSPRIVNAIRMFPSPKNITGIRAWFGLVNQVSYAFAQTEVMAPFRDLLKKDNKFYWDSALETLFQQTKLVIIKKIEHGIKTYDCSKATCLSTDWCKHGIGFLLFQQACRCDPIEGPNCGGDHWVVVFAGSRFTTSAESRYAPIEGEALAVVYGLVSCKIFILGCPNLVVSVDHKPLVKVLGDQPLGQIKNPRLQKMKEKTMPYQYRIKHTPGKENASADAASRYPVGSPDDSEALEYSSICSSLAHVIDPAPDVESEVEQHTLQSTTALLLDSPHLRAVTWQRIAEAASKDRESIDLAKIISAGFPSSKKELPEHLRVFWPMREDLYCVQGVPVQNQRILIPPSLRAEVLEGLHAAHQGVTGMSAHAKQRFFWPGLDAAIRLKRAQCTDCNNHAPSQSKEPFCETHIPEFPFESTCTDIFHLHGYKFLMYVDRFTGWLEIAQSPRTDATAVCSHLRRWFTTFGVAVELASDGGPPYDSNIYKQFLKDWGVTQRLASAHFPQSNGRAELGVKSGKRLLRANISSSGSLDNDKVSRALMAYRNTPLQDYHLSPAELLFGKKLKDHLPLITEQHRAPKWEEIRQNREKDMASRITDRINTSQDTRRPLASLTPGQHVLIQDGAGNSAKKWGSTGIVTESLPYRQYFVKVDGSNRPKLRNRIHLKPYVPIDNSITIPKKSTIHIPEFPETPQPVHTSTPTRSNIVTPPFVNNTDPTWRPTTTLASPNTTVVPQIPLLSTSNDTPRAPTTNDSTIPYNITNSTIDPPTTTRKSVRFRQQPQRLSPKMKGKSHITKK